MSESDRLIPKIDDPIVEAFQSNDQHRVKIDVIFRSLQSSEEGISSEQAREVREATGINYLTPPTKFSSTFCCGFPCFKDDHAMDKYHEVITSTCLAKRNGKWGSVDTISLVPGDVVRIGAGDRVPADMRLFKSRACTFDASALKGTSVKVEVDVNHSTADNYIDSSRIAFLGYRCVSGECMGVVLATGDNTLLGHMISAYRWPPKE